jgi:hypothetical protein
MSRRTSGGVPRLVHTEVRVRAAAPRRRCLDWERPRTSTSYDWWPQTAAEEVAAEFDRRAAAYYAAEDAKHAARAAEVQERQRAEDERSRARAAAQIDRS